jgi:hypothetical protein
VVVEIIDFKDVDELMRFMLTSAVVYLAIQPTNQPILPNAAINPIHGPHQSNQSNPYHRIGD